jgi:hypothetical protein
MAVGSRLVTVLLPTYVHITGHTTPNHHYAAFLGISSYAEGSELTGQTVTRMGS